MTTQGMRICEEDGLNRVELIELAKRSSAPVTDRVYALELLKKLDQLFVPYFGIDEELK